MKTTKYQETQMSQLQKQIAQLTEEAIRDELTGLHNRRHLNKIIPLLQCTPDCHIVVVVVDLDRLKIINDHHGHAVGDDALCLAAKLLTTCCRKNDYIFRTGGDEFLLILPKIPVDKIASVMKRLHAKLEKIAPLLLPAGFSFGITHGLSSNIKALIVTADHLMYQHKSQKVSVRNTFSKPNAYELLAMDL